MSALFRYLPTKSATRNPRSPGVLSESGDSKRGWMELIGRIRIRLRQNRNRLLIESMIRSLYSGLKFIEERWIVSLVDVIEIPEIAEPNAVLRTKSSQPG